MTVEETLRRNLLIFPGLFPTALELFNHMFLVIGNGYYWVNGELVELVNCRGIPKLKDIVLEKISTRLNPSSISILYRLAEASGSTAGIEKEVSEVIREVRLIFEVDQRITSFESPEYKFSELTEYSKLCCLPDDIKNDWLNAAEKMYNLLVERGCEDTGGRLPGIGERIKELRRLKIE